MQLYRFIASKWALEQGIRPPAFEKVCSTEEAEEYNEQGYNVYFFPNHPSDEKYKLIPINVKTNRKRPVDGADIDIFQWVFVDMDLKDGVYKSKEEFINIIQSSQLPPSKIIDSGNGVHVYWKVADLDGLSFLKLGRRLMRLFKTDDAVQKLAQLMRVPGTVNVKDANNLILCQVIYEDPDLEYTCEQLDSLLPPLKVEDQEYVKGHWEKTFQIQDPAIKISKDLPYSFLKLCESNNEVKSLFYSFHKDRSGADWRMAILMHAAGMTSDDATSVLMNTAKASERNPQHQYGYAKNIVQKLWNNADDTAVDDHFIPLSKTVAELLNQSPETTNQGKRIYGHPIIDATEHGFRLSEVMGLIGATGGGKSTISMNFFIWFCERNPEYDHLYVSLEMGDREIAEKWRKMTVGQTSLHSKVHILGNYDENGKYRELGLKEIQDYILALEKNTGRKIGCIVLDHVGVIKQERKGGEFDGLIGVCKRLKSFAIATNTFVIVQSQTSREKGGIGDIDLDVNAAYGTSQFEFYCDYVFTVHQPLKRVYKQAPHMTVTAIKLCKVRHVNVLKDKIKKDVIYPLMFDPNTDRLRELTSDETKSLTYWDRIARQYRNRDKSKDETVFHEVTWTKNE